ncbi:response regulator [Prochlorothrix hollandica]|uniref:Chemotaxis protein CheY n=1 Tax=Prochlorothrix hollandica PCC 9006 = CALU 1027 TaxID=317619 RepID=A0A0M2PXE3_PROHO|nr:response regulator [Prochlorothrix hollandica]KKJ01106.1 chemotaxis protein CheY [Prochlorothrix hollandica PCC 9006 = CALU 1027]
MTQTILVVDDQSHIRFLLEKVLEPLRREGVLVVTAVNGFDALKLAEILRPQLIFLDILLPKLDGFEVCRRIKQEQEMTDTYVAFVTAKGEEGDVEEGLAVGGDRYITKPFDPDAILKLALEVLHLSLSPMPEPPF